VKGKKKLPMVKQKEKKYLLLNWVLLTGYACINLFALYSSAYSWPTQGSIIWFLLIIFCPPFLYHLVFTWSKFPMTTCRKDRGTDPAACPIPKSPIPFYNRALASALQ